MSEEKGVEMSEIRSTGDLAFQGLLEYPEMRFPSGKFSFLAGPSGSGKSTYLRLLNRTAQPSSGEIFLGEEPISSFEVLDYRRRVLLVPQEVYLKEGTIAENFRLFYRSRREACPDADAMRAALDLCQADFSPEDETATLSGGESQRVFLAIFLTTSPEVLLLDKPTTALDESTSKTLLENLKTHAATNGTTVICISHSEALVSEFSDYTARLTGREKIAGKEASRES